MEIKTAMTIRGFVRSEFTDAYGGACTLQESSAMGDEEEGNYIWLGIADVIPKHFIHNLGWVPLKVPEGTQMNGRMHLTQAQVRELLPLLQDFVDNGYLTYGRHQPQE